MVIEFLTAIDTFYCSYSIASVRWIVSILDKCIIFGFVTNLLLIFYLFALTKALNRLKEHNTHVEDHSHQRYYHKSGNNNQKGEIVDGFARLR